MTWWSMGFLFIILLVTITVAWWGKRNFSATRARNIKYLEQFHDITPDRVIEVQRAHPEIIKIARLDRHRWFIVTHMCILAYSICVFSGAELTSNVAVLGATTRYSMAVCFFVGSSLVLLGSLLGKKVWRWTLRPTVSDHLTAGVLGDDIAFPYQLEMAGMGAMVVSAGIYAWTSFGSTSGSLGGWLTGGVTVLCISSVPDWYAAVKKFQKWDDILISEAKKRAGVSDAD